MGWTQIPGAPGYEASRDGRVRGPRRVLKPFDNGNGYLHVRIGSRNRTVHGIVAETFIGPRPDGHVIRHLDGDRLNNAASNLAYGTQRQNVRDQIAHGTFPFDNMAAGWRRNTERTECRNGHPLVPYTGSDPSKKRWCPVCHRAAVSSSRLRRRQDR